MTLQLRPALALLAVAVLNLGTIHSWGFYSRWALAAVMVALCLAVLTMSKISWAANSNRFPSSHLLSLLLVVFVSFTLTFAGIFTPTLLYNDDFNSRFNLWICSYIGHLSVCALLCGFVFVATVSRRKLQHVVSLAALVALTFLCGFLTRAQTIRASPDPVVDVYTLLRDGADHIIDGKNPYANDIISPYGTARARYFRIDARPDPRPAGYPPLSLLLAVPSRLLGADVRWSNVIADLVAAAAIVMVSIRRRAAWVGAVIAATYLNLARAPFIIEQAWYEPMIAALLGLGLFLSEFDGWRRWPGYILIGLGLTAKQFGLPLLLPLAWAQRRNWKFIVVGLVAGGLVILPFFLWSPRDFLDIVLWKHLDRPLQPQSITVGSFLLNEFGIAMPRILGWLAATAAIVGISFVTPRNGAATALGLGTALLAFCVFHTQGFPNYFYLVQYLWLLGFVGLLPRTSERGERAISSP